MVEVLGWMGVEEGAAVAFAAGAVAVVAAAFASAVAGVVVAFAAELLGGVLAGWPLPPAGLVGVLMPLGASAVAGEAMMGLWLRTAAEGVVWCGGVRRGLLELLDGMRRTRGDAAREPRRRARSGDVAPLRPPRWSERPPGPVFVWEKFEDLSEGVLFKFNPFLQSLA